MRRDDALLLDMLLACRKLVRFTQGLTADAFQQNELVQSAVIREFQVLGDAARLVTDATEQNHPQPLARDCRYAQSPRACVLRHSA